MFTIRSHLTPLRCALMATTAATAIAGLGAAAHAATPIDTAQPFYLQSAVGTTVNPDFQGGTLRDNQNNVTDNHSYTVENSATNTIDEFGDKVTFTGTFSGGGPLTFTDSAGGGTAIVTGTSVLGGAVTINTGATLQWGNGTGGAFLVGAGDAVADNGSLVMNFGSGSAVVGAVPISGTGSVTIQSGSFTELGASTYTGTTTINTGATLSLASGGASNGSVAGDIVDNGLVQFNYGGSVVTPNSFSGTGSVEMVGGTTVITGTGFVGGNVTIDHGATMQWGSGGPAFLVGAGNSVVDNGALTMNFGGGGIAGSIPISGTGTVELQSGSLNDSGASTYTGTTTIDAAGVFLLTGAGSIANSSNVIDSGVFDISGTTAGAAITTLTGAGGVSLGAQTLTLTNASGTFAGVLADGGLFGGTGGGLTIAAGTETLTGTNTYTGATTIDLGATLRLGNGGATGTVAGGVVDNGLVQFNYGGSVVTPNSFSGTGSVEMVGGTTVITGTGFVGGNVTIDHGATMQWGSGGPAFLVGAGNSVVDNGALTMNFGGGGIAGSIPISGTGTVELQSGSLNDSGASTYTGTTTIDAAGVFLLTGAGSIANSSNVIDSGVFDISGTTAGASITTLTGAGGVSLGAQTLTLTNASGTFAGVLADGGLFGGTGGGLTIAAGTETLTGTNTYTGATTIDLGATLRLGNGGATGTVAGGVVDNGLVQFNYGGSVVTPNSFSGTGSVEMVGGTTVITGTGFVGGNVTIDHGATMQWGSGGPAFLVGAGNSVVDNGALTMNFGGGGIAGSIPISGTGTVELQSGSLNDSGASTYTGTTTIDAAGVFLLTGAGSIANSSNVIDSGVFDISGTTAGAAITTLTGAGGVSLGAQTLTLTNASGTFAGVLADGGLFGGTGGGLTIAAGTETLTGTNTFTGLTTIDLGATLKLVGAGSIADSADPLVNGTFDISGASGGVPVISLSGSGQVLLGPNTLTLTNASDTFAGGISGAGGLTIGAGDEILTGVLAYTGATTIDTGAGLQLGNGAGAVQLAGAITDNGLLVFDGGAGSNATLATAITGTGAMTLESGTLGLTGTNTYTGPTQIDAGATLKLGNGGATGTVAGLIVDNGLVQFDYSGSVTTANGFTGSGSAELVAGTLVVTGLSALGGTVTIDSGATMQWGAGNPGFLVGAANGVVDNGALVMNFGGGGVGGSIPISGSGSVTLQSGSLNDSAASTYIGVTTIDAAGVFALSGAGSIAASSNVVDNGVFDISGTTAGTPIKTLAGAGGVSLGSQTLTLTAASGAFSGVLADGGTFGGTGGGLTLAGGTETLTGTNTYTGLTTINTGATLKLGAGGTTGTVAGSIVDNGLVQFNYSGSVTTPNGFSGSGSAELVAGTLVVTGLSALGGTVTIDNGATMQWGAGNPGFLVGAGNGVVDNGALVMNFGGGGVGGSVPISGSGSVTLQSGSLNDSAANTYTGVTTINAAATFALSGAGSIAASSNVIDNGVFDISGTTAGTSIITLAGAGGVSLGARTLTLTNASGTFSGVLADGGIFGGTGGGLTLAGGIETLTGTNTYTGLTTINTVATLNLGSGGASGGIIGPVADNGTLNVDRSNLVTFAQSISGSGTLNQVGGGTTVLNAANPFTGLTTISAGVLEVGDAGHAAATLGGNVVVGAGGTLMGHGTIGGSVVNGGVVAPGGTIGTLTVGSYTQSASGTLAIEVSPTAASLLNVIGPASLNGKLAVSFDPGVYSPRIYQIVAGHPVTGTFTSISTVGSPGEAVGLIYQPTQVDLVTEATASAQIYGGVSAATLDRAQDFATLVEDRFGDAGCADGRPDKSAADCQGFGAWAFAIGSWDNQSASGGSLGFRNEGVGVIGGIDRSWENGSRVGGAFGYAHNDLSIDAADSKASGPSYYGAIYGRLVERNFWFDGQAFYMHTDWSAQRGIPGAGAATSSPNTDSEGFLLQASVPIGDAGLRPYARITYVHSSRDGAIENGFAPLGFAINSATQDSAIGEVGLLYAPTFTATNGAIVRPSLEVGVQDNAGPHAQTVFGSLAGVSGSAFGQVGPRLWGVAGVVDGSLKVRVNRSLELFGDLSGRFSDHQADGVASVGGVIRF